MFLPPPFLWLDGGLQSSQPVSPPDVNAAVIDSSRILAANQPQRASSLHLVELALSLRKDEFTGRQNPKLNKN